MVNRLKDDSGKGRLGCMVWILIVAAIGYYGQGIGLHYIAYYRMKEEMESQARLAPGLDDGVIRRRLIAKAEELDLPSEAKQVSIRRLDRPHEIVITSSWQVILEVPFYTYRLTFRPSVRESL
ncbi:MAG TPA: hypothetical protein VGI83_07425 [Gemmatimonadales bacterium]